MSGGDLSALIDLFYDEAKFLRYLLREVNQVKADGKTKTGFELVVKTKKLDSKREVNEAEPEDSLEAHGQKSVHF